MTEPEELLKLIDGHIEAVVTQDRIFKILLGDLERNYYEGMKSIRWLVYNFFNAPKKEQSKNDQQDFGL